MREVGGCAGGMLERRRVASTTMMRNACHLIKVVAIWRYLVLVTLQNTNWPIVQTNTARNILYASSLV